MESREISKMFVVLFWILCHKVLDQRLVFPGHISRQFSLPSQNYWALFKLFQQVTPLVVVSFLRAENAFIQVHSGHSVMFVKWNGIPRNLKIMTATISSIYWVPDESQSSCELGVIISTLQMRKLRLGGVVSASKRQRWDPNLVLVPAPKS